MKFRISFDIDATGTSFSIKDRNGVNVVLQNLSSLVYELHKKVLSDRVNSFSYPCSEDMKIAMRNNYNEKLKLTEQIFNNWKVEGTMEDGKTFTFTHKEPGYQEEMTFH